MYLRPTDDTDVLNALAVRTVRTAARQIEEALKAQVGDIADAGAVLGEMQAAIAEARAALDKIGVCAAREWISSEGGA